MPEGRQQKIKDLFLDVSELPSGARADFLASACAGDDELRKEVEALVAAHARSESFEDMIAAGAWEEEREMRRLGEYELVEVLGRGAAGTVYLARQPSLGREVALKVLRAGGMATETEVQRFRREAEAAAALDHPGIVPVFDIGEVDGHHFFSMKRVDGTSLDRAVERVVGSPRRGAQVVSDVARAVHHAHQRGVLHRDLKPSNILIDSRGAAYVSDFGIAQPMGQSRITQTGLICGTPAYMSPEQARGDSDVTVATDVWSLGCVLQELLTGEPPFGGNNVAEVLRRVQDVDPPRPVGVDRDLATIIGACLAKDPSRRYPSALALSEDLDAWLAHLPITARPATRFERLLLTCRRSPAVAALGLAVGLLLVVLVVGSVLTTVELRARLADTRANLRTALVANARAERSSNWAGRRATSLAFLERAAAIESGPDLCNEAITSLTLPDLEFVTSWRLGSEQSRVLAADQALRRVVVRGSDDSLEIRAVSDGALASRIAPTGVRPDEACFTHNGERLWVLREGRENAGPGRLEVFAMRGPEPVLLHDRLVEAAHLSRGPGGRLVALGRRDGTTELIDGETFELARVLATGGDSPASAFRPDGDALAFATGEGKKVEVIAVQSGESLASLTLPDEVHAVTWSPDGKLLAAGCFDQRVYVWETSAWEQTAVLRGHEGEVVRVVMPRSDLVVTLAWDGTTRFWDVDGEVELLRSRSRLIVTEQIDRHILFDGGGVLQVGELVQDDYLRVIHAHQGKSPREVAESPDRSLLATCGSDGWMLWGASPSLLVHVPCEHVESISFGPAGDVLTSGDGGLLRWPVDGGAIGTPTALVEGECRRSAISSDGAWIGVVRGREALLISRDGSVRVLGEHRGLDRVAFSADGTWIAIGSWGGQGVRVWDTRTGELAAHVVPDERSAMPTFSPDGAWMTVATHGYVRILKPGSWSVERDLQRTGRRRPSIPAAFSLSGDRMAFSIASGRVRLVRVEGWRTLADLKPTPEHELFHMCFVGDDRRLAIASPSQRLLVWELGRLRDELSRRGLDIGEGEATAGE
ncbi:MAG: protein kinase [bacterium]|nr:protein kinase [bacterium]